jgi:hypothetical protein
MLRSTLVWALVALNVLLMAALVGRWMKPSAAMAAPAAAGANRPGDYIIVPAEVIGGNGAIVYVIDTTRGQLSAMGLENNRLASMAPVDLNRVFDARAGAGNRARD